MTQEDKDLLLKDLCSRLPYGIKCWYQKSTSDTCDIHAVWDDIVRISHNSKGKWEIVDVIKPYLRPMSSMTIEEHDYYNNNLITNAITICEEKLSDYLEFMYSHHFDLNRLIENGLALEAPEDMYKF